MCDDDLMVAALNGAHRRGTDDSVCHTVAASVVPGAAGMRWNCICSYRLRMGLW